MEKKTNDLVGKKLLILGGVMLHCELVNTAKRLGVETYVTDYLPPEHSPAKRIADHAWDLSVLDVDAIVEHCREEKIDGVLNMYDNVCQIPHQAICERLGLPSFGTKEHYEIFTDKKRFLETCVKYGLDIIPQYREEDFAFDNPAIEYPIYVKPGCSGGSAGQSVCRTYAEVKGAIEKARRVSMNNDVVIERFMENALDEQLSFFMIDGKLYIENFTDKYNGSVENNFSCNVICGIAPSQKIGKLAPDQFPKIENMLRELGIRNAPVFLQAFLDGDKLRCYDPALRLPGSLFEVLLRSVTGIDVYDAMIRYALTGSFPEYLKSLNGGFSLNGMIAAYLVFYVRPGTISRIIGLEEIEQRENVLSHSERCSVGDKIEAWTNDYRQWFCSFCILCRNLEEIEKEIQEINNTLKVLDENGEDMRIEPFDTTRLH